MSEAAPVSTLTPEQQALCDQVCQRIAEGESLRKICASEGMPKISTFLRWCLDDKPLADQYARARDIQMDVWAEECLEIADDDSKDFGFKAVRNEEGESAEVFINKDNIQRAKLRIDERHWQMSKQRPKKYGDLSRHEHSGPDGKAINIIATPLDEKL
jgi:hypothetical protein